MRLAGLVLLILLVLPASAGAAGDPRRGEQWGLDMIESDAAHATATGAGAVVAVIDSGVQTGHPDLAGRLLAGTDLVDGGTPEDGNGHGTHVSGIIAAAAGNGVGISSVAPGAKVLPVRVLDDAGGGNAERVARGIDWARQNGAHVINLSLGSEIPIVGAMGGDDVDAAIRRALAAGIVVVAASGNNGVPVCEQPAAGQGLLCVGSVDKRGQRSFFSSFGQGLAVVAPGGSAVPVSGEDILSTVPPSTYAEMAGTSQAAPHVAGVAALLVGLGVRGQAAARRIVETARDAGPPGADPEYGRGIVNARAAVAGLGGSGGAGGGGAGGGAGGGPGGGGSTPAFASTTFRKRAKATLRRGIRVRVRAPRSGRVRVRVTARGRTIARGSRRVQGGVTRVVTARLTRYGRRLVRRATPLRARVRVSLPGEPGVRVLRIRIVRRA
jgi:subtilisin family serine protease